MQINKEIIKTLKASKLDVDKFCIYLLVHYFKLKPKGNEEDYSNILTRSQLLGILDKNQKFRIDLFGKSKITVTDEEVERYRNCFAKEISGFSGKTGSKAACKNKLETFLTNNPQYDIENIITAAKYYVRNFQEISGIMQQADYLIYKLVNGYEHSRLESIIDEAIKYKSHGFEIKRHT